MKLGASFLSGSRFRSEEAFTFCSNCGTQCPDPAKFCSICGSSLSINSTGSGGSDRLLQQVARDVNALRYRKLKKYKLLLIPLILMLLFGLVTLFLEIASYVNGVGPHR